VYAFNRFNLRHGHLITTIRVTKLIYYPDEGFILNASKNCNATNKTHNNIVRDVNHNVQWTANARKFLIKTNILFIITV